LWISISTHETETGYLLTISVYKCVDGTTVEHLSSILLKPWTMAALAMVRTTSDVDCKGYLIWNFSKYDIVIIVL
jgi:hypothetical protein